jgi:N-acetylneuraminic acid mutarotase
MNHVSASPCSKKQFMKFTLSGLICLLYVLPTSLWADQWLELNPASKPPARFGHTMVDVNGVPYVFGGLGSGPLNDLWRYDPNGNTWNQVVAANSHPDARYYHSAISIGGKMYICGGAADGTVFPLDMWIYDPSTNQWSKSPSTGTHPGARFLHSAAADPNGSIYVFGGLGSDGSPADGYLWQRDPNGLWTRKSTYPAGVPYGYIVGFFDNRMYVFGGFYNQGYSNDMVVYDPNQDLWQELPVQGNLPQARCLCGAAQQGNLLWIFGGEGENYVELNDTWQFNTLTNNWTRSSDTPIPLAETQATNLSDFQILVYGGRSGGEAINRSFLYTFSAGQLASMQITPNNPTMFTGQSQTFIAQGYDPNGIEVPIDNPQWEYSQNCGKITIDPNALNICTFTATQPGNGYVACFNGPIDDPNSIHGSTDIYITDPNEMGDG